jgi:hypothetical protein
MKFPRTIHGISLFVALVILTACGGGGSSNQPPPVNQTPDFTASLSSATAWSGGATGSASYTVTLDPTGGFSGSISLTATGLPSGVTATFSPASVSSGNSTLTLSGTKPADNTYPFTITASGGSITHSLNTSLVVPGPVSVNAVIPPGALTGSDASAIQNYIAANSVVAGGTFQVEWSAIDNGSGYNWAYSDALYNAFAGAGRNVNFVFWANADSSSSNCSSDGQFGDTTAGNCAIPTYVWTALTSANYTTCTPSNTTGPQRIPNYLDSAFQINYQNFMAAAVAHYNAGAFPKVKYIRFGLGHGGETLPVGDWNSGDACAVQLASWGLTVPTWEAYLTSMLAFEHNLGSSVQLMVGMTPMGTPSTQVPDAVAVAAVPLNIGIGSQGLESSDVNNCAGSTADWCNLFNKYFGQVPLELQTVGQSCPNGGCPTGSLVTLLPFAVLNHVTILEIYYQDWLTGYDPNYAGYTQTYATVLQNTATGQ